MKGIIPTGGRGTRMRPVTYSANKHLIPVGNRPLIFYPLETVADAGIKEIGITYNPGQLDDIKNLLGDGSNWGLKLDYVLQEEPKGVANIAQVCEEYLAGDSFVFHLGDNIFSEGIRELVDYFRSKKPNGLLPVLHHPENTRLGVPFYDADGKLIKYVEKPKNPPHDWGIPGLYLADHHFFECFRGADAIKPSARGEYEIPDPYQWLIDHGYQVETMEIKGRWLDPGKFDDWIETNRFLLERNTQNDINSQLDSTVTVEGKIDIGHNCQITNSRLSGPLSIGDNVTIRDSNIGPYSSIYNRCQIIGSGIENSVVMEGSIIEGFDRTIDTSIIAPHCTLSGANKHKNKIHFFIGELSQVEL